MDFDLLENFRKVKVNSVLLDFKYRSEGLYRLNLAYAKMLLEVGFITRSEHETIVSGLKKIQKEISENDVLACGGDIYFLYESKLLHTIDPAVANKLHVGRSRNDMYFTMYRISLRDAIWQVTEEVLKTQRLLHRLARENLKTIIPYYTYGQPAQPGTWGHYLTTISELFSADLKRIKAAFDTVNQSPMGSAAGIGSSFKLDKHRVAELLGFNGVIENTSIGNSAVDYFLQTISAFAILNTSLSRISSDLMFFSSTECGILDCDDKLCGHSSIMPQKKNAAAIELLRSQTEHLNGYMSNCFSSASSTTIFPVHETYFFFERFWDNVERLIENLKLLRVILEGSTIREKIAYLRAFRGFTAATAMAEQLTQELNKPFTITHHIVGGMIKELMQENTLEPERMTPELMKKISKKVLGYEVERTQKQISQMLDPLHSLEAKITGGSPKPSDTEKLLSSDEKVIEQNSLWLQTNRERIKKLFK